MTIATTNLIKFSSERYCTYAIFYIVDVNELIIKLLWSDSKYIKLRASLGLGDAGS